MKRLLAIAIVLVASGIAALSFANPYLPNPSLPDGAVRSSEAPAAWIYDRIGNLIGMQSKYGVDTYFGLNHASTGLPVIVGGGFGTSASMVTASPEVFKIVVGTGSPTSGVLTMPQAPNGWACNVTNVTPTGVATVAKQTADTATSVTVINYTAASTVAAAFSTSDELRFICGAY